MRAQIPVGWDGSGAYRHSHDFLVKLVAKSKQREKREEVLEVGGKQRRNHHEAWIREMWYNSNPGPLGPDVSKLFIYHMVLKLFRKVTIFYSHLNEQNGNLKSLCGPRPLSLPCCKIRFQTKPQTTNSQPRGPIHNSSCRERKGMADSSVKGQ